MVFTQKVTNKKFKELILEIVQIILLSDKDIHFLLLESLITYYVKEGVEYKDSEIL